MRHSHGATGSESRRVTAGNESAAAGGADDEAEEGVRTLKRKPLHHPGVEALFFIFSVGFSVDIWKDL